MCQPVLLSSSNLECQSVDLAHGDESGAAATESERVALDGPVGDELAGAHIGELGEVHDAAPPVLADPAATATLGSESGKLSNHYAVSIGREKCHINRSLYSFHLIFSLSVKHCTGPGGPSPGEPGLG